ncbi:hypothetical protein M9Y10_000435 [Tritrichomonas musculus]|uniref:ABC transporter domain-containing protein n=1 Tax=Tritrichomonas musculus TaxID=1915356 RepID=A0ABR2L488_9EUKA
MGKISDFCPPNHLKAVLYRRYITFKRSWVSVIFMMVGTLVLSALGIAVYWMTVSMNKIKYDPITFLSYPQDMDDFLIIGENNNPKAPIIIQKLKENYIKQTGRQPRFLHYDNITLMQEEFYNLQKKKKLKLKIPFGLDFTKDPVEIVVLYNATTNDEVSNRDQLEVYSFVLVGQALWELQYDNTTSNNTNISLSSISKEVEKNMIKLTESTTKTKSSNLYFNFIRMNKIGMSGFFEALCPMFLVFGLLTIVLLILTNPIKDIRGEVRTYMVQCTLKIFPYWFGAFIVDLCIWIIITTIVWGLFNLGWIKPFHDNLFSIWWVLVFQGPSFILFLYGFSFIFKNPESAPRQIFIILLIINFIVLMITLILHKHPIWLNWIWSLFPTISIQQVIFLIMKHTGMNDMAFHQYWKDPPIRPFFIMQWVDIVIYGAVLTIIEVSRSSIAKAQAKHSFISYSSYFQQLKDKNEQSPETKKMEDDVHNSHDWAVRIEDVSRLFINTAGKPIPAVNSVCLGIKKGACFGFLGANGAGKTTLMRMITGMLPPSSGSIEIFQTPFDEIKDKTVLSICPQFNTHLFKELTPKEHFKIYAWLFQKDPTEAKTLTNTLISELELIDFQNIPIRELSAGDVRKLAIAISFFGPSKLLLLDEPTAFLDPVACHCVQELILEHKGEKTFMLCTHILNEAELLCDVISIMVRGNVYTVGTPQYLTQKFGTEYKIDIMLTDASEESDNKLDLFFNRNLPYAQLTINRPASRIYSVPASKIQLAELFLLLENGQKEDNGYKYFTCSTSSLERVFMEIVRISEEQDMQNSKDGDQQTVRDIPIDPVNNQNTDEIHLNFNDPGNDSENSVDDVP